MQHVCCTGPRQTRCSATQVLGEHLQGYITSCAYGRWLYWCITQAVHIIHWFLEWTCVVFHCQIPLSNSAANGCILRFYHITLCCSICTACWQLALSLIRLCGLVLCYMLCPPERPLRLKASRYVRISCVIICNANTTNGTCFLLLSFMVVNTRLFTCSGLLLKSACSATKLVYIQCNLAALPTFPRSGSFLSFAAWFMVAEPFLLAPVFTKCSCGFTQLTYSFRPDSTEPAQIYWGKYSATALTHSASKGCSLSATARPGSLAKPFCPFSDCFDFRNKDGKVDTISQVAPPSPFFNTHTHLTLTL